MCEGEDIFRAMGIRGAGSHHIFLDLTVRHGDAQRSLSWGEGRSRGEGTPGSGLCSSITPEAASGARSPEFESG